MPFVYNYLLPIFVFLLAVLLFVGGVSADTYYADSEAHFLDNLSLSTDNDIFIITCDFNITANITISKNITIMSNGPSTLTANNSNRLFYINATGFLTLEDGLILTGGNIVGDGGAVYVDGGMFTMTGGTITENYANLSGSGVYLNNGTFSMSGGTITENNANQSGGGVYLNNGTFTMTGGTISNNNAAGLPYGGGGGGVWVDPSSLFTMSGGSIKNNNATYGGGILSEGGPIDISGNAVISGNNATTDYSTGGGVWSGGMFKMSGGTINDNTAESGGGVIVISDTFTMFGGTITNNTARMYDGGGVFVVGNFTMSGGHVSSNTAKTNGGGVMIDSSAEFTMLGGDISGNSASLCGSGVYNTNVFQISGSASIDPGNNVCLNDTVNNITVMDPLDPGAGTTNMTLYTFSAGDPVVKYGSVSIPGNWETYFALNTTWIRDNQMDLALSGTNLTLDTNFTIKYYLADSDTDPYSTLTDVAYDAALTSPVTPTRIGYIFSSWNQGSSSGTPWNFTSDTVKANNYLYACWTTAPTPMPTSSGSGDNTPDADAGPTNASGTYVSKDGSLILQYAAGASYIITIFQDYFNNVPAPVDVSYLKVYDVHSTAGAGTSVTLTFRVNASELAEKGLTAEDISILHYVDGAWHLMTIDSVTFVDGEYWFTVTTTYLSQFMIAYNVDGLWFLWEGADTPTKTLTDTPTSISTVPTSSLSPETGTPASPAPVFCLLAGFGVSALLMRKR